MRGPAVYDEGFVVNPIGDSVNPPGPVVQKQNGNAKAEQKYAFQQFKERDQLEIANAVLRTQNLEVSRGMRHAKPSPDLLQSATIALPRQQISSLFPSGSSKNNA